MLNFGNKEFRNLQEQVLKNAQDIEALKGRTNLQVVIVEELPEVGNPNYIYLVAKDDGESPDVYDEYIWLVDEERYENIGGVSVDLTNYVDKTSNQTISGNNTLTGTTYVSYGGLINFATSNENVSWDITTDAYENLIVRRNAAPLYYFGSSEVAPKSNNARSLGTNGLRWKNLYLSGEADFGNDAKINKDSSNRINILFGGSSIIKVGSPSYVNASWLPEANNTHDLGSSSYAWKDAYIAGNISDGVNSVTVANISTKTTSSYQSGTFDSNGESTFVIADGTFKGLFIFIYGNCQCMFQLTETMVQNADQAPIRIACPMIYNSGTVNGWLQIDRSTYTFTIKVTDGTNHVDSGYAWTLTKTNLL